MKNEATKHNMRNSVREAEAQIQKILQDLSDEYGLQVGCEAKCHPINVAQFETSVKVTLIINS